MNSRADLLRRRIEHYRRLLAEGVDSELARHYLRQIAADLLELSEIEESVDSGR